MPAPRFLRREAHLQILADGEAREDLAALAARSRCRARRARTAAATPMLRSSNLTSPERIGKRPIRHLSSVVLPTPLRPEQRRALAVGDVELRRCAGCGCRRSIELMAWSSHRQSSLSRKVSVGVVIFGRGILRSPARPAARAASSLRPARGLRAAPSRGRRSVATKSMSCSTTTSV